MHCVDLTIFHKVIDGEANQIAGLKLPPILIQAWHHLAFKFGTKAGFARDRNLYALTNRPVFAPGEPESFIIIESHRAGDDDFIAAIGELQDTRPIADICLFTAANFNGLFQGLSACPKTRCAWIATIGHGTFAEINGDHGRIFIDPVHRAFGFRCVEAPFNKLAGFSIELAANDGVFTAVRQVHDAESVIRGKAVIPLIDPVFVFSFG